MRRGEDGWNGFSGLHRAASFRPPRALDVEVLDTTGAGDSYCGGFLAGLVAGRPAVECAVMGTVSASFVVEACGALATPQPTASERADRFSSVLRRVTEWRT
jgi:cytidine kinase